MLDIDVALRGSIAKLWSLHGLEYGMGRQLDENAKMRTVRAYIDEYFDKSIAIDEIADLVGLNPIYLVRAFRQIYGLPPQTYQRRVRIERAKEALRKGLTIADVAVTMGFADQSHFTRQFKAFVGTTPGVYRH